MKILTIRSYKADLSLVYFQILKLRESLSDSAAYLVYLLELAVLVDFGAWGRHVGQGCLLGSGVGRLVGILE